MLQNNIEKIDWELSKEKAFDNISNDFKPYFLKENKVTELTFPIEKHPIKVSSLNLSKSSYEGVLTGIKGQYLIFEDNTVFNIRGNEGTEVIISID